MIPQVVYHAVPENMQGTVLHPRNELRSMHPELAAVYDANYVGREEVAKTHIPSLDCNWGDVLFMSPVYPQVVIDELRRADCPVDFKLTAYEIPLEMLDMTKLTVMITVALGDDGKRFVPFDAKSLKQWQQIPQITLDHYKKMHARGEQPFTYGGIPHFLYKGNLNVKGLRTIKTV